MERDNTRRTHVAEREGSPITHAESSFPSISESKLLIFIFIPVLYETCAVHAACRKECPRVLFQTVGYKTRAPLSVGGSSSNYLPIRHPTKKCGIAADRAFTLAINAENIMLLNTAPHRNNLDSFFLTLINFTRY